MPSSERSCCASASWSMAAASSSKWSWWGRAAAAAVLTAGLLSVQPGLEEPSFSGTSAGAQEASSVAWLDEAGASSTVDDIENPTASVYHFDDEELGLVMVVDAGLDV